jgi:hypothetical protein
MDLTPKMVATLAFRNDRIESAERQVRQAAADKHHPVCVVRGDAIAIACKGLDMDGLRSHPGFHCFFDGFLRNGSSGQRLPYSRIARFRSKTNGTKFWVYSQRLFTHLPNFRICFYPDDWRGLRWEQLGPVLEFAEYPKIVRLEVAFDFGPKSGIDSAFVRQHAIFGKCEPTSVMVQQNQDNWGQRGGTIFARSYFKEQIGAHRVELQLNNRYLRRHHLDWISDFPRLVNLLPNRQIFIASIDEQRLITWLRNRLGKSPDETLQILKNLHALEGNLIEALEYLRQDEHLANTRRLLIPLDTNKLVLQALKRWAKKWVNIQI